MNSSMCVANLKFADHLRALNWVSANRSRLANLFLSCSQVLDVDGFCETLGLVGFVGILLGQCLLSYGCLGGVSERPKERASKARVGETQPWVQIPPPPPCVN